MAKKAAKEMLDVLVVSNDKDMMQLVDGMCECCARNGRREE